MRRSPSERWLSRCASVGEGVQVTGPVLVRGHGEVVIGDGVVLDAAAAPIELNATSGARLELGARVHLGPGTSIEAAELVVLGADAVVGPFGKILDNNWHGTGADRRETPQSSPVLVGAGARVGTRATLLPGAGLGDGAMLLDDSVLSRRVPDGHVVTGVPARLARGAEAAGPTPPDDVRPFQRIEVGPGAVGPRTLRWLLAVERMDSPDLPRVLRPVLGRLDALFAWAIARWQWRTAQVLGRAYVYGPIDVINDGEIEIGDGVNLRGGPLRSRIVVGSGARLAIGVSTAATPGVAAQSVINYGVFLSAQTSVQIGARCLMGSRVLITDQLGDLAGPVVIEDDVWLAHGVTVLPGVTIGRGAAVSAGTVVDRDIPPGSLAFGAPVRFRPLSNFGAAK
ncbi:MAG: acyltransferase [Candidatus Nanopelagicales bacterium]